MLITAILLIFFLVLVLIWVWEGSDLGFWVIVGMFLALGIVLALTLCYWLWRLIEPWLRQG